MKSFTEEEQKYIKNTNKFNLYLNILLRLIGFILILFCGDFNIFKTPFEIFINIFFPYVFIPIKIILCKDCLYKTLFKKL